MAREPIIVRDEAMRKRVVDLLAGLDLGKPWSVTVEPYRKKRTLSQNALYWSWIDGVVKHVHDYTGQDKDDIHEAFKRKFLTPRRIEVMGQTVEIYSTKALSTGEMSEFCDKIYAFVTSEFGILLPHPEDAGR